MEEENGMLADDEEEMYMMSDEEVDDDDDDQWIPAPCTIWQEEMLPGLLSEKMIRKQSQELFPGIAPDDDETNKWIQSDWNFWHEALTDPSGVWNGITGNDRTPTFSPCSTGLSASTYSHQGMSS